MTLCARVLENLAPWRDAPAWRVGFSGGLDSTVLLHVLASLAQREAIPALSAIYIDHGLQAVAQDWPAHCQQFCARLAVPLHVQRVHVDDGPSLERAAREARYREFNQQLAEGEALLLAQHRDDQAETLMFRLLRGAGVRGLAAMAVSRPLGAGVLLRPLLNVSQAELREYALAHRLSWIEDPSNADQQYSRNYLRHSVLPALHARWPQALGNIARAAEHLGEASQLLDELAIEDLQRAESIETAAWRAVPSLSLPVLRSLSEPRQRNALRYWLRERTKMPDTAHWASWITLRDAAPDASPVWRLAGGEIHRADERLWWLSGDWLRKPQALSQPIISGQWLALPGNGRVRVEGQLPDGAFYIGYRQGGEVLELPERGHRDLKRLLNEHQVPVFIRARLPLLMCQGRVCAVANVENLDGCSSKLWRLVWQLPTSELGLS